ncbi:MAG: 2-dehydropantoate 2-reductase [Candidatus Omnitrophica bacterium]|nr:2-dehydropantoate 2-reductase [Candidatus Omnitrophota bacterium]
MNVVIVGAGALGSLLGAILAKKSTKRSPLKKLILFDHNRERAALVNKCGITVEAGSGCWRVPVKVVSTAEGLEKVDLVLVCVKAYDTKKAIRQILSACGEKTLILSLQNGLGNIEVIAELAGSDKVIGGVTSIGATLLETGHVRYAGKGETVIGRLDGKIPVQMRAVRQLFQSANLPMRITRDIRSLIWSKLIINAGINALSAVTRLPNGKLLEYEGTRAIMRDTVTEAVRVAKRKRIKLSYDDPLAKVEAVCEATAANHSSMLQDISRGRHTEIDYLNGVIVRQARELGIAAPVNSVLVNLVRTIE